MTAVRRALYETAATLSSLLLLPALASRRWRGGLGERLGFGNAYARGTDGRTIWVHGASVGEVVAARSLVAGLLERRPGDRVFFTTFTVSGKRTAAGAFAPFGDRVSCALLPLDWWGTPGRALARIRPRLFIILETEIWPGLLDSLTAIGIPVVLVNGRISVKSLPRYRAMRWFFKPFLENFRLFCVRTQKDAARYQSIGAPPEKIRVTGNIKYDSLSRVNVPEKLRRWKEGLDGAPLFVAGSLRKGEGRIVLDAFARLRRRFPDLVIVLVPRYPDRFDRKDLDERAPGWTAWSTVGTVAAGGRSPVIFVDTVGDLPHIYGAASLAFVGGTLEDGRGHNMLEPAAWGVPVLFGPSYRNFEDEAEALLRTGGGFVVGSGDELARKAEELLGDPAELRKAGKRASAAAASFEGALGRTLAAIDEIIAPHDR